MTNQRSTSKKTLFCLNALIPLGWGMLSYLVFTVLKPMVPNTINGVPIWIPLWIFQLILFLPIFIWILRQNLEVYQPGSFRIGPWNFSLGKLSWYLTVAYLAAFSTLLFPHSWYTEWLVFGAIVSPIIEEIFSRQLLSPWLKEPLIKFLGVALISSTAFALMHWGYNSASAFDLPIIQQFYKFLSHFIFAFVFCLIYRWSKSIQLPIIIHILSNLHFVLGKL